MRAMWMMLALMGAACGPVSEEDVQAEWDAFVDANNSCEVATDCAVVYPGCPLGCFSAVSADAADDAAAEADRLLRIYERAGRGCDYDCEENSPPTCDDGVCNVESAL